MNDSPPDPEDDGPPRGLVNRLFLAAIIVALGSLAGWIWIDTFLHGTPRQIRWATQFAIFVVAVTAAWLTVRRQ
jgi:hypothetical protein